MRTGRKRIISAGSESPNQQPPPPVLIKFNRESPDTRQHQRRLSETIEEEEKSSRTDRAARIWSKSEPFCFQLRKS